MARTLFSAMLSLCLLGSSTVTAAETAPDFQTTTPAVFLSRPAPPAWWSRSGESWIAVFGGGASRKFELKTVQSKIYVDSRDAVIKLGAQNSPDPLFFLSGMKLKTGTIETAEGIKLGKIAQPLRAALTGRTTSPGIFDVLVLLGQGESLARIEDQISKERN